MSDNSERSTQLEEERDFLLKSLRDLEQEHKFKDIDDQDFETLRKDYVSRAASVIKQIESLGTDSVDSLRERPKRKFRRAIFVSLGVLLVASFAGWLVAKQSGQRLAGDSLSGSIEDSTASILSRARATNFVDPQAAIELYSQVLVTDPDNVEALTYRAWLIVLISRGASEDVKKLAFTSASADFERAIKLEPSYPDAHCFLGIARFRLANDAQGAKDQLTICAENNPPAEVQSFVESIIAEVDAVLAG